MFLLDFPEGKLFVFCFCGKPAASTHFQCWLKYYFHWLVIKIAEKMRVCHTRKIRPSETKLLVVFQFGGRTGRAAEWDSGSEEEADQRVSDGGERVLQRR